MLNQSNLKSKRILVTGGAGFIGSNLCEYLLEDNCVTCVDNLITGKRENILDFLDNPKFEFLEMDLRNNDDCKRAVKGIDIIFHQAALGSVPRSIQTPIDSNAHNVTGFLNLIEAARTEGVKRFIYATSSSVYGDHPQLPKKENIIGRPMSPYAITKHVNELYAEVYGRLYGMETIGLRYFNVFGRHQDPNGAYAAVIPKFIQKLLNNEMLTIHGDGEQTRDFTYIDNVIQANVLAATTNDIRAINKVFNIAFGSQVSLNELLKVLKLSLERNSISTENFKVEYAEERTGDIKHSYASIDKAKNILNYNPQFSLERGLDQYVKFLIEKNNKEFFVKD